MSSSFKIGLVITGGLALFSLGFLLAWPQETPKAERLTVTATIFPLAEIARAIGQESVEVITLVPPGAEAHDYQPSIRELAAATESEVLLTVGGGFDDWISEATPAVINNEGLVMIASQELELLGVDEEHHDEQGEGDEEHHHGDGQDPHFWLDPTQMMVLVLQVEQLLMTADPDNAQRYQANAEEYRRELGELHDLYEKRLATCESREIVVTHDAYSYLAARYELSAQAILGLAPADEPSVGELADMARFIREKKVTTIFFEEMAGQALAQTLVEELGVRAAVLSPLENVTLEQAAEGATYTTIMKNNLEALTQALVCR